MSKARLTKRVLRGLDSIYALANVNQYEESDLYAGCRDKADRDAVDDAIEWLGKFIAVRSKGAK